MAAEDVNMEDAADGSVQADPQEQQPRTEARKAAGGEGVGDEESDDEVMADTAAGAGASGSVGGAAAHTPAGGADGAADTAANTPASNAATGGKKTPVERPTREDPAAAEKLRAYVATLGGTLPAGWMGVYKMRVGGTTAGQYDLYYRSPEGRMIRSRAEVLRILGLDPSGGAAGAVAATRKAATGKGPKKKAAAAKPAEEVNAAAADAAGGSSAAAGAPLSSPGKLPSPGGQGVAGSKWTLPVEVPRKEALEAAKERATELGLKPPFTTDRGVTILNLGIFNQAPGFYDATHIWPLGYRAAWIPPQDPTAVAAGAKKKSKKKEAAAADNAENQAKEAAAAETGSAANGGEQKATAEGVASAAPPQPPQYRFISEIRAKAGDGPGETTGEGPSFAVLLEPNPDAPGAAATSDEPLLVHAAAVPDVAWSTVVDLQVTAMSVCKRAKPNGAGVQPSPMQRALAAMPPVGKVWGMDCFGLSDVRVLQLLEALPGVGGCEEYLFVQQRNSWELEATAIATKRNVVLSAAPNRRAAAAATKQRKRQQQLSIEAFVDRAPPSPKADDAEPPAPEDVAAATATTSDAAGAGGTSAAGKKSAAKPKGEGKAGGSSKAGKADKGARMTREDLEIRGVLDRLVERVSLVMAEPDEKERQKMIKAMEKSDRAAARRREKTAEKAAEKAAAGAGTTAATPEKDKNKDKDKSKDNEEDKEKGKKPPKAPKSRATKDKTKDKENDAAAVGAAAADAAPDAAAAAATGTAPPQMHGNQVDERTLPTAEEPAPPGMTLELSYPIAGGSADAAGTAAPLTMDEVQQLLSVYQFLWDHRKLLGMEGRVPSLADLLAIVSEPPARLPIPARRAADEVHLALVRLLVDEALEELLAYVAETSNLPRRDLSPAPPPITSSTWPEVLRRYLAAAAAARYLATSEPRSSALVSLQLPGQLQNLEPADWLHYLLAGLNFPHLLSRIALLPHASSRWAADALLAADDARARAAAERALQGVKSFDLQHLDGEGQVRRGRRLLHALLTLPEGGEQLGFYAPEFGEVVRAPRGLDLHMVTARLDAGLYQSTGDWLQAMATDVRSSLALWRAALNKGKEIPGHQDAQASLADAAEQRLGEMLADPDTTLALPAPPDAGLAPKAEADTEMQDADAGGSGAGGKSSGKAGSKSRKGRGSRSRKQQQAEGSGQAADEEDEGDPCSLDDPTRLFNPRDGCRVCWLDEDKNRILLCDGCDAEYHCYCVEPPLLEVPEGAWFCSSCTARGLGLSKGEDEKEDHMDADATGERRSTPRAATPSRAAATGEASISPSDGAASGRTPCSPSFQHCHSHSHLVSDLHDRAAARRPQPRGGLAAAYPAAPALPAANGGSRASQTEVGEAPLSIPADVPEGPRVALRANSRPGLQELDGLLRLAHLLGNYDYATGGPATSSIAAAAAESSASGESGWTPARRLALLATLCELAMDTNALRSSLDEIVETRKKARVEALAIRSKARQIQEEQAAAKKAAAEKENAPKPTGDADANAGGGTVAATTGAQVAGKGSKGGKGDGAKKDAKGAKSGKTGKDGEADAEEPGGTQEAKEGKEGGETAAVKSRNRRTDLSVLPEEELKRLICLEAQVEGLAVRQEALGEDRHGSSYWWLGADHLNPQGQQGVVLVEQLPPGHVVAEQNKAAQIFDERQAARKKEEEAEQARKSRLEEEKRKAVVGGSQDAAGEGGGEQPGGEEPELDEWGLPKERPRPRVVAIGVDTTPGCSWAIFHTPNQLNTLIGWLHPKGVREGPLRTGLLRARDRIAASQAPAAAGDKQKQPVPATEAPPQGQQPQEQPVADATREDGYSQPLPPPPPQVLCPCVTVATAAAGRRGGATRQGSLPQPEAASDKDGSGAAPQDPVEAVALRTELLALHRGLPAEAFSRFWGSAARQERWCAFVGTASTPPQLCAALTVLEAMLVDEAFRPHWRLYCMPAQHPDLCTTWAAVWYRLGGLQGAIRKQIIPPRDLHHQAAAAETAAHGAKLGKGSGGKKEKAAPPKQQSVPSERYSSRRAGTAVPALPDISNVRSREAAALLPTNLVAKRQKDAAGSKGRKDASSRGQKRQRSVEEDEEEDAGAENAVYRKRNKRAATVANKNHTKRPVTSGKSKGKGKEQMADEDEVAADDEEEVEDGSDADASPSGAEDDDDDDEEEEEEESSDGGRKRKARPSRASARLQKQSEKSAPTTRRSSRLRKAEEDDMDDPSDDEDEEEEEEEARPAKRTRAAAAAAKSAAAGAGAFGRQKGRSRGAVESDDEDGSSSEEEELSQPAKGQQGRTRGGAGGNANGATATKQANGAKPPIGSRAAAILANRKRALGDWSEESEEDEEDGRRSGGSNETSSSEDEPPPAAVRKRGGSAAAAQAPALAAGKRETGRQQQTAARKPPLRRMARSEVEYDVEDFDDLNT